MAQRETSTLNGDDIVDDDEATELKENTEVGGGEEEKMKETGESHNGEDNEEKGGQNTATRESPDLPIVIDDLAQLGVEWMITKTEEGTGNWGKEYETSESLENIDDGQLDVEAPPPMPNVKVSSHGQTMHLVPLKDDGRTSTSLTWIRKTALRKDSASDRRVTIRGLSLGDLFQPRIYTLIQMAQSIDYSSTDRTIANSCSSGILTINFRTILDRVVALRRYLLDIEITGRRLEIVCTFPDHKRPPDFETLWKAYEIEGVPPCSSQRADREILAKQVVVKNLPDSCDEDQIRMSFGNFCDEVEFVEDYKNSRCAIVTFLDATSCHFVHARQNDIAFEDGTRPEIYLMTDMMVNSKLMPKRMKEETEEERTLRHTFEILWYHQQKVSNAMHIQERYGGRPGGDYLARKGLQMVTRKLPSDVKQRVETRAVERKEKEAAEIEKEKVAAQEEALKVQQALVKTEHEGKSASEEAVKTGPAAEQAAATPAKRPADVSPDDQSLKRPRKKPFRGGSGGGAGVGMQRRGMSGSGGYRREQLVQQYQRGENRGYMGPPRRGGPPSASPPGRFPGRGYPGEVRASPWLVPPGAAASGSFDRHMDVAAGYGSPAGLMARRDTQPPYDQGGGAALFGGPGGLPYTGQVGYMSREMEMQRGSDLYQRRDSLGPDFQRTDYRGFYGKH